MDNLNRRKFIKYSAIALGTSLATACSNTSSSSPASTSASTSSSSSSLDKVSYGTNWFAQAEHGGFYQAVATGIYKEHGLDVTIKMGGPQINGTQLLMGGAVDFFMGYGADAIFAIQEGIPKITVAAIFQKDPQVLLAHPNIGVDSLEDLKGKPIFVSQGSNNTFWPFLKAKYGFTDDQKRPYNFNPGPFLADKNVAQQGYLSSEPYKLRKQGVDPVVLLLADFGYSPYSTTIETRREIVEQKPDLVQRFVDASIKGWYSYFEDPAPANALIKKDNPEMTDDLLAYGLEKTKEYGTIISGDAETKGIGAMTDERWKTFYDLMAQAGIFKTGLDYQKAYSLQFVNKGVAYYTKA